MPELPEVEYTAQQLRASIIGATIQEALVFWERVIGHPELPDFQAEIAGRTVEGVRRRGKFLVIELSGDLVLTIHRRMTGNLLLLPPGWEIDTSLREVDPVAWSTKGPTFSKKGESESDVFEEDNDRHYSSSDLRYCRVCFNLADGRRLLFTDQRKFGRIELWTRSAEVARPLETVTRNARQRSHEKLGPEPFSEEFTPEQLLKALSHRKRAIKQALLEQEIVAGLGNIYADEALYYASIHPLRRANSLNLAEIRLLHEGIVAVLTLGIKHGGTSFSNYRDLWGEAGVNYNHVSVYHRQGKPCPRCGTLIERIVVAQRGTHFCPSCQKLIEE